MPSHRALEKLFHQSLRSQSQGNLARAEAGFRKILRHMPDNPAVLNNLAVAVKGRGALAEAADLLARAVAVAPGHADGHNNLGTVLVELGRVDDAIRHYRRAIELNASHSDAFNNLGSALRSMGAFDEAVEALQKAVAVNPNSVLALDNLGDILAAEGCLEDAERCYEHAQRLSPSDARRLKQALLLPPVYTSQQALEDARARLIGRLDALGDGPLAFGSILHELNRLPFYLAYQGYDDTEIMTKLARLIAPRGDAAPVVSPTHGTPETARVAFVSSCWHNHSVGNTYARLASEIAHEGFDVCLFDGRPSGPTSEIAGVRTIMLPRDLAGASRTIVASRPDILVYPDIGFDPFTYFLAATRLAPVQCVLPGHPVPTGLPTIDYFLTYEGFFGEGFAETFTEHLTELDWFTGVIRRPSKPEGDKSRAALGLPETGKLYVCPMMLFKVHPAFDDALVRILERDPQAWLIFFADRYSARLNLTLRERFQRTLGRHADRVRFLPHASFADFMRVLMHADVALDTVPFAGGTTSLTVLGLGTPLVTLPTPLLRGRATLGYYRAMGLDDCVASDLASYVELAVGLANDSRERARIKERLLARSGVLYDNPAGARAIARFFREVKELGNGQSSRAALA